MTCLRWQRLLWRTLFAVILSFVIQACAASGPVGSPIPGSAPPPYPPFDAYDVCVQDTEANQQDCFKQAIQVNHLALPAGTTTEQAFAKYKDCVMKNAPISVSIGEVNYYGDKQKAARQNCFTSALQ